MVVWQEWLTLRKERMHVQRLLRGKRLKSQIILLIFLLFASLKIRAQLCQGSLGDPIVNINFGSGSNPGPALSPSVTGYTYVTTDCPSDGQYSIRMGTSNCFSSTWHTVTSDHTGNGYCMVVNASNQPSDFYIDTIRGLCSNTTFELASWVLNVLKPSACSGSGTQPNLTFKVEKTDGTVLNSYNTGNIPPQNSPLWKQYGFFFNIPAGVTDVVLRITNNAPGGCGNDLLLDDITFRPCGPLVSSSIVNATTPSVTTVCVETSQQVQLAATIQSGYNNPVLQWQQSTDNGATWQDIPGANTNNQTLTYTAATPAGIYKYRLSVTQSVNVVNTSCRVVSQVLTVNVSHPPVTTAASNSPVCEAAAIQLTATGGISYAWSGPNSYNATGATATIENAITGMSGKYYVTVTNSSGCTNLDSTVVTVNPQPIATVTQDAYQVCNGTQLTLSASGGSTYKWYPGAGLSADATATVQATAAMDITYHVIVGNQFGCADTAMVTIQVFPVPAADAGPDKNVLQGLPVQLNATASSGATYLWTPPYNISGVTSLNPTVSPLVDTTYTLTVTSNDGCGFAIDKVKVHVFRQPYIPNAFSPNGDGINDLWQIGHLEDYPGFRLLVFNRYGQSVFESRNSTNAWNGRLKDKPLPVGTYYYLLDVGYGFPQMSGWVMLLR
jgi:gliding motility-associated-like protein